MADQNESKVIEILDKELEETLLEEKKRVEREILTGKTEEEELKRLQKAINEKMLDIKLEKASQEEPKQISKDNWVHRSAKMRCGSCMSFVRKKGRMKGLGRCRRKAPTLGGWPAVFEGDWCGDHKINENYEDV